MPEDLSSLLLKSLHFSASHAARHARSYWQPSQGGAADALPGADPSAYFETPWRDPVPPLSCRHAHHDKPPAAAKPSAAVPLTSSVRTLTLALEKMDMVWAEGSCIAATVRASRQRLRTSSFASSFMSSAESPRPPPGQDSYHFLLMAHADLLHGLAKLWRAGQGDEPLTLPFAGPSAATTCSHPTHPSHPPSSPADPHSRAGTGAGEGLEPKVRAAILDAVHACRDRLLRLWCEQEAFYGAARSLDNTVLWGLTALGCVRTVEAHYGHMARRQVRSRGKVDRATFNTMLHFYARQRCWGRFMAFLEYMQGVQNRPVDMDTLSIALAALMELEGRGEAEGWMDGGRQGRGTRGIERGAGVDGGVRQRGQEAVSSSSAQSGASSQLHQSQEALQDTINR